MFPCGVVVKAGGMRIVQKHPHNSDAKEEKDKDDQDWETSSPPKPAVFISGVIAREMICWQERLQAQDRRQLVVQPKEQIIAVTSGTCWPEGELGGIQLCLVLCLKEYLEPGVVSGSAVRSVSRAQNAHQSTATAEPGWPMGLEASWEHRGEMFPGYRDEEWL
ncbi:hypothetical protein DV515_00010872 [Chloebia gouldiae]|uniref:Uncharacterized protein n=1 Tax=Chloebia gouldiae TaxID=44316 RepID=A0A3L8S7X2_CHLGU|nr:hypothetical protein DV515_00010872 [Chloebia gouldiae]